MAILLARAIVFVLFLKILVRFARCLALRNGSWPWPGHQRRGFCPRGEESDMRHDMT